MEKSELISKMVSVLSSEFEVEESVITDVAPIKDTLHLDSLSIVDMVGLIQEEFGVEIKAEEVGKIRTFGDLYDYVYAKL